VLVIDFKILYGTVLETVNHYVPVSFQVVRGRLIQSLPARNFIHGSMPAQIGVVHICIDYPSAFVDYH
jgi:hypothetical protein